MKVIGIYSMANFGGVEVLNVDDYNDSITYRYNFGEPEEVHETVLHDNDWFVTYTGLKIGLDEVMRVW